MNCSDVQQALPEMIDGSQDNEYQVHLKSCPMCSELATELELIARESRQLSETDEPAPRVWVRIAAELRAEGIISEMEVSPARPVLQPSAKRRWNAWWLVPVVAALLVAGSYLIKSRPTAPVASQTPPAAVLTAEKPSVTARNEVKKASPSNAAPQQNTVAKVQDESPNRAPFRTASTADQELLNGVSPQMRSTYEKQLQAVNAYIHDADSYLQQNPGDEDARQHLMDAYEQREMLYQMALDHVQ